MTDSRAPSQKLDQYMLRLPDGMRDQIKLAAEANNRSMNAEIIAALTDWLSRKSEAEVEAESLRRAAEEVVVQREYLEVRLDEILARLKAIESKS